MRVRRHVESGAHAERQRPEVIEQDEGTHHQALHRRECPANLEFIGKIAQRRQDDLLNGAIGRSVRNCHCYILPARLRRRTALRFLTNQPQSCFQTKKRSADTNSNETSNARAARAFPPRYPHGNLVVSGCLIYNCPRLDNSYSSYEIGLGVAGVIEANSRSPLQMALDVCAQGRLQRRGIYSWSSRTCEPSLK